MYCGFSYSVILENIDIMFTHFHILDTPPHGTCEIDAISFVRAVNDNS